MPVRMSIRTEVGMPVKTKKPRIGAYRALSEPIIPNTGRWFVYSKMEPICVEPFRQKRRRARRRWVTSASRAGKGKGGVSKKRTAAMAVTADASRYA